MNRSLKVAAGVLISLGFVWVSLRGKDLAEIWTQLKTANYLVLIPYFAILLIIHVLRTVRWGLLIAPLEKMSFRRLNAVSAVGFMALIVLPFRLGEFARPYLIRVPGRVSATAAMASIVVERVLDGLMVAALLVILLLRIPAGEAHVEWVRRGGYLMFAFFFALLVFLVVAYYQRDAALRFARATLGRVSPTICEKLCTLPPRSRPTLAGSREIAGSASTFRTMGSFRDQLSCHWVRSAPVIWGSGPSRLGSFFPENGGRIRGLVAIESELDDTIEGWREAARLWAIRPEGVGR